MITKIMADTIEIYLRKIELEDTELIIRWRNSEYVRPFFIYQEPFTREGHLKWIETMIDTGRGYQFMICEKETLLPIGCVYLRDYEKGHKHIEYGIFIGEHSLKGKGVGTLAARLIIQFAFEQLQVHRVFARVIAGNIASSRIMMKAGLQEEARLRDHVFLQGEYKDLLLYGILENECKKVNGYYVE
ncbi:MAG: GNAT family protein [Eubacteriales bacterium]